LTAPETHIYDANGQSPKKCAMVNGNPALCIDEAEVSRGGSGTGALYVRDNKLYQMVPEAVTGLRVDTVMTRL